tara:strand:+ start:3168 stop:3368 length:201 start_codon:yes stop_codon:yes gene_type:complete
VKGWQNEQYQLGFGKPYTDSGVVEYEVGLEIFFLKFDLLHHQLIRAVAEGYSYRHLAALQVGQTRM